MALTISVVFPLTVTPLIGGVSIAHADDLPGNAGGAGTTNFADDTSNVITATGGRGNGYGGGGAGGSIGATNTLGGDPSMDGVGGDGAFAIINDQIYAGGAGGSVGQTALGMDTVYIIGGAGSQGIDSQASGGGGGGAGLFLSGSGSFSLAANSTIAGGTGGNGGAGIYGTANGAGGGGGAGVLLRGATLMTSNATTVVGGDGGNGGSVKGSVKAGGGAGGDGIVVQGGVLINQGSVKGGDGGAVSYSYSDYWPGSSGGSGGSGVYVSQGRLVNRGQINGGVGGPASQHSTVGVSGSGVRVGSNSHIVNEGTISAGGADANAVDVLGSNNTFEIHDGSSITGNVVVAGGTQGNTFVLGGSDDGSFDVSLIGTQYQGFQSNRKDGSGTWTLTGTGNFTQGFTIADGVLSVSSDASLGAAAGGLTLDGGTLQVTGTSFTSTTRSLNLGEHGGGLDIADAGNTFTVTQQLSGNGYLRKQGDGTLVLSGNNNFTGGLTIEKGTVQAGTADHAFGSGLLTVNEGAKVDLANFNTTTGGLAGAGDVAMGGGNLTLDQSFDTLFSGVVDGSGALTKTGSGTLTLAGVNSYTGQTVVSGGTLKQGAQGAFNASSSGYEVASNGTLDLGGYSTSLASLGNTGNVNFGGTGGTVLNIAGNYTGNGGMMTVNTVLGGDDSKTDMLKVDGDTSGSTKLYVNNAGGSGAQTVNGIKVVDVSGSSNGSFSLANSYKTKDGQQAVVGGAYAYTLQQGSKRTPADGDWYLVSHVEGPNSGSNPRPRYSAGVPVYEGYVQNMLALNKLPTLQQRVGSRYWTGENGNGSDNGATVNEYGVWARVEGGHNRLEPDTSTSQMKQDINTVIMQAGVDGQFYEGENGKLIGGITGQYGHARGDVSSFHGDGDISTDAWSLGATATWYGNNGFYVDGQGQVTWFDNDLNSWTANTGLADGRKATGYALSIEAGQRIPMQGSWALTPQAQLMWSSIDADEFSDTWGSRVSLHDGDSLLGRLGLAADYRSDWKGNDELMVNTSVYGIANVYQAFLGGTTVNVSGIDFETDNDRTWAGIGAGGTYAWADNKYAVYGDGSINTSLNHFANSYAVKGSVGFKVKW
ncbi:autotransporter outer membrane beta-barrel domain-containing protein [Brucella anthropi]|nr:MULTISPECIES: autotransporter outer membrane beta-barrel domain-containing protein [Brucella/Ochrobactrum group]WKT92194.1 autotransporter outer membrane beta-barrel domain-containing protein [Brucella anthropi]